jgi:RNA polymerase sigma factor (TIGR02999 family)
MTLDSTGLAHEAYERLIGQQTTTFQNRAHFFAIAARTMRQLLVDRYRARHAEKRGGGATRVSLSAADLASPSVVDLDFLNRALDRLAVQDSRQAQIVELRFFAGLTIEDTALAIGVSPATVKREWAMARAWLRRELTDEP